MRLRKDQRFGHIECSLALHFMTATPSLAHSLSTSTSCSAHSCRVQHRTNSSRVPVTGSTRRQYLAFALSFGAAVAGDDSGLVADTGEIAAAMPNATISPL